MQEGGKRKYTNTYTGVKQRIRNQKVSAAYADSGQCLRFHRSVSTVLRSNLFLRGRSLWKTFLQQATNKQTNVNKQCIKAKIKQTREDVNK